MKLSDRQYLTPPTPFGVSLETRGEDVRMATAEPEMAENFQLNSSVTSCQVVFLLRSVA